ncbi:hypothetical protein MRB53_028031 [Persea americana]|uniref:Uncharacterized protein n=1 Tax=Persea americana TaxID=3435 RepID=A0ACC2KEV2_PERAE|nr:hypothetical protein MRB53_028031 [Persea americana]
MILSTLSITVISMKNVVDPYSLLMHLLDLIQTSIPSKHLHLLAAAATTLILLGGFYFTRRPNKYIYLIGFSCYRPPDWSRVPLSSYIEHTNISCVFNDQSIEFQKKLLERSGLGNETCFPVGIHQIPPDFSFRSGMLEVETVMFTTVQDLLTKLSINPTTIDILITSCGIFCTTPSMATIVINKVGLRSDVRSFHLAGMGCSASLKSIDLARDLLRVHKNSLALVISMEATTTGYQGKKKSMLVTNCLFRMGGVAILLSNHKRDKPRARYLLQHLVCTHTGSNDTAYNCITQELDDEGIVGVSLSKDIVQVAGDALKANMKLLGPLVLPYTQLLRYGWSLIRSMFGAPIYVPDFHKAFEHFCIHAGGKAVIDAIGKGLGLDAENVEASRMTLYRFGNTSAASIWYSLCYMEAKGRVKKGDRVWQISLGSGFKCNSAVWKCVSDLGPCVQNAWSDRTHRYPVEVPNVMDT